MAGNGTEGITPVKCALKYSPPTLILFYRDQQAGKARRRSIPLRELTGDTCISSYLAELLKNPRHELYLSKVPQTQLDSLLRRVQAAKFHETPAPKTVAAAEQDKEGDAQILQQPPAGVSTTHQLPCDSTVEAAFPGHSSTIDASGQTATYRRESYAQQKLSSGLELNKSLGRSNLLQVGSEAAVSESTKPTEHKVDSSYPRTTEMELPTPNYAVAPEVFPTAVQDSYSADTDRNSEGVAPPSLQRETTQVTGFSRPGARLEENSLSIDLEEGISVGSCSGVERKMLSNLNLGDRSGEDLSHISDIITRSNSSGEAYQRSADQISVGNVGSDAGQIMIESGWDAHNSSSEEF